MGLFLLLRPWTDRPVQCPKAQAIQLIDANNESTAPNGLQVRRLLDSSQPAAPIGVLRRGPSKEPLYAQKLIVVKIFQFYIKISDSKTQV